MQEIVYHTNYKLENDYWWFIARNKIIKKLIDTKCNIPKGSQILDVGAGTGGFASFISKDFEVVCLDTSEIALQYCEKRGLQNRYNSTLDKFPAADWNIQAVTMLDVVEHIEDDAAVVKQVYGLLPKGGSFIAAVPAYQWLWSRHDEIHMHYRRYNKKQFTTLLKEAGFKIEFASYYNSFLFMPAVLKRFIGKIFGDKKDESPVDEVPGFMNKIFTGIFSLEAKFLPAIKFPAGVSIVAIATKE